MRRTDAVRLLPFFLAVACTSGDSDSDAIVDTDVVGDTDPVEDTDVEDTDLPLATGVQWFADVRPFDVTPDGRTVGVQVATSFEGEVRLLDTATGEMTFATTVGDVTKALATGLSADHRISALHGVPVQAGVWSAEGDWTDIASPFSAGCDPDYGGAFDLSDDGTVAVGLMWDGCAPLAFRWTEAGGVQVLETLGEPMPDSPSHATNRASVVSGDGQVSAGFASNGALDRSPALWTADGEGLLLDPTNQDAPGEVHSISFDGTTVAGNRGYDGFVWTAAGGFVDMGRPDTAMPSDPVYANAMTGDGGAVFGAVGSEFFGLPIAFVWTAADGSRALQPLVEAAGVEIPEGFLLTNVLAASDDGTVLAGTGFDADFMPTAFVLTVPASAYGR